MELGIYTFAELTADAHGETISPAERLRNLIEEIELADQVGLDVFGVGEHHRPDFAVSAPAVVLAAGAERTRRIRLTSVTAWYPVEAVPSTRTCMPEAGPNVWLRAVSGLRVGGALRVVSGLRVGGGPAAATPLPATSTDMTAAMPATCHLRPNAFGNSRLMLERGQRRH